MGKGKSGFKILYCDDSLLVRRQLKEILEEQGFTNLIEASDGEEAVEKFEKEKPDLVFCDIVMPKLDGLEALIKIKNIDKEASVVMISTSGTKLNLTKALNEGAKDFIQKPFDEKRVKKVLSNFIEGGE